MSQSNIMSQRGRPSINLRRLFKLPKGRPAKIIRTNHYCCKNSFTLYCFLAQKQLEEKVITELQAGIR